MTQIGGKSTLITGAAMGIGRELARRFAREEAVLVLWDIDEAALRTTAEELRGAGATVHTFVCDVSRRADVYAVAERVKREVGPVDILVNNAGILHGGEFLDVDDDKLVRTFEINVFAQAYTMRAFLPDMIARGSGHVVNVASAAGLLGVPNQSAYCASKHAVIGMTDSVRVEVMRRGLRDVRFTIVEPIWVNTALATGVEGPRFTGVMTVEYIAGKIVAAVKANTIVLREPWLVKLTPLLKAVSPPWLFDWGCRFLRIYSGMDRFTGKPGLT